jgi:hypothetical protein
MSFSVGTQRGQMKGVFLVVGSLGKFFSALAALVGSVQNIFSSPYTTGIWDL